MRKKVIAVLSILLLLVTLLPAASVLAAPDAAPTNLRASVQPAPLGVVLTWADTSTNEAGFRVYRSLASSTDFAQVGVDRPASDPATSTGTRSTVDDTVQAGVTYSYRVVAFDSLNAESAPTNPVTVTVTIPAAPSGLEATQQAGPPQTVTLTWNDNSNNEAGFKIERADNVGFTQNLVLNAVGFNTTTFVDADVLPGATYSYRVSAIGNAPSLSATSNTATITVNAATGMVAGPLVPVAGFPPAAWPLYYQDVLGTKLSLMPIGGENAAAGPIAGNTYSEAINMGAEAFYYLAESGADPGLIVFAIEAIWANASESPVPGDEMVMNRTRFRFDAALMGAAAGETVDYTVTTPYGTFEFPGIVEDPLSNRDINFSLDVLGLVGQDFATATTGPVNTFWFPNDGVFPSAGKAGGTIGPGGPAATVTITGSNGFSQTISSFVIFGRELSAAVTPGFTASVASGSAPLAATFTDTSVGSPTSWAWDFGDSATSTVQSPDHTYTASGNFIAKLTASNAGGTASTSQMVNVYAVPVASFTAGPGATQTTINFAGAATNNPTGWLWDFGDGSTSTLQSPSHVYSVAGEKTVTLTAFNPAGNNTTPPQVISVGPPPAPTNLLNTSINLTAGTATFQWTDNAAAEAGFILEKANNTLFTDNLTAFQVAASAGSGANVTFTETGFTDGNFFYRVVAVNALGQRSTASNTIQVNAALPIAPSNLAAQIIAGPPRIRLTWVNTATNAQGIHVERAATSDFAGAIHLAQLQPPTTTTFVDDSVALGNTFSYRVHAFNAAGMGENSNAVTVTVDVPAAIGDLTAGAASPTQVTLNWSVSPLATGYTVERSIGSGNVTFTALGTLGAVTTFNDTTVSVGNVYNYRVLGTNILGPSAASNTATVELLAPVAPVLNAAVAQANGTIDLNWNNVANEQGYRVQRSTDNTTFTQIAEVSTDIATYTDTAAAPATAYFYKVTAFNGLGTSTSGTVSVTSATPAAAPAAPTGLLANATAFNNVNLTWTDASTNEAGYRVWRATSANITNFSIIATLPLNSQAYADTGVVGLPLPIQYQVTAFNSSGNSTAAGPAEITSLPAAPSSGGGGGGGGGGGATSLTVSVSGLSGSIQVNSQGITQSSAQLSSSDGKLELRISSSTRMLTSDNSRLSSLTVAPAASSPEPTPPFEAVVEAYDFGPDGATFDPAITMTLNYDPAELPEGTSESNVVIAFWDGSQWQTLETTVDTEANSASAMVSHFSTYALLAGPMPAVSITSPQSGVTLTPGSITVALEISNFTRVAPGGDPVPGEGHLHYYMDVEIPTTPGQPAVTAAGTYKVTDEDEVVWENVSPGSHTFGVQLVNNNHTPLDPPITATVTVTVAEPLPAPSVNIVSPQAGATLQPGNITVTISVADLELVAPGEPVPGQGHIHYYMDVEIPTIPGQPAVSAPGTYKAGPSTTNVWENVAAGTHTFGVQLVNNNHTPLEPPVTATVTVTVQSPVVQPTTPTPTTPTEPSPASPPQGANWWLIGGLIALAVIIIAAVLWRRRGMAQG